MENKNIVKNLLPRSWRTQAMHERYQNERQADVQAADHCPLCKAKTIQEFTHWRIIDNKYPYDAVAAVHEMIVPMRHCTEKELTSEELAEYSELKQTVLNQKYSHIFEALPKSKSIPGHHHLHLIVPKIVG